MTSRKTGGAWPVFQACTADCPGSTAVASCPTPAGRPTAAARPAAVSGNVVPQLGGDLGRVPADRVFHQRSGQAAPVDLGEDPVEAEGLLGGDQLLGDLGGGSAHDRV